MASTKVKHIGFLISMSPKVSFTFCIHAARDNGNDFSFLVPSPFLKINDNYVKSFLNGYPKF